MAFRRNKRSSQPPSMSAADYSRSAYGSGDSRTKSTTRTKRSQRSEAPSRAATPSRGTTARQRNASRAASQTPPRTASASRTSRPSASARSGAREEPQLVSTSVGEIRRAGRRESAKKASRGVMVRVLVVVAVVVALVAGWAALYNSSAFAIQNVQVNGVEHLTSDEMSQLANVPSDTTLLRVDTASIEKRLRQNAWVADVKVNRAFPNTLEINVTERTVQAIVEIPTSSGTTIKQWMISDDHIWLMPIPDAGSDAAKTTSSKVYEDAESVLHITDVPIGTKAEIGSECSDGNVNNALDIVTGLTTELSGRVAQVSAAGTAETTLILDSGVEIAFGKAEDIRDKERVVLEILSEHPGVAYINVRMVETPTWREV